MGRNYKITLQYEGTRYDGWQKQGNTENTIQGKLEQVLSRMCGFLVEVHGSGRTDAGVHALGQVANFHLPDGVVMPDKHIVTPERLRQYLNHYLPDDIAVTGVKPVSERFHSRLNAKKKIYLYRVETAQKRDVFARRMQYGLGRKLDVEEMKKAAVFFVGTHDFRSFCGNKKMKKSAVRTVYSVTIHQEPGSSVLALRFVGNGFLQHMVRIMAGTLIEVGLGERQAKTIVDILEARDRQAAGFTAPAEGLCLVDVLYGDEDLK